jgi:multiphosphoryl transfer protein
VSTPSMSEAAARGRGSSPGVGVGSGVHVDDPALVSEPSSGGPAESLDTVFERAQAGIEREASEAPGTVAQILRAQLSMLADPSFRTELERHVDRSPGDDAAALTTAITAGAQTFRDRLTASSVTRIQERARDVDDLVARLTAEVTGAGVHDLLPPGDGPFVLVASDLLPSQTARMDPARVAGIVLEGGGPTAHAAIIARALAIPLVTGLADARDLLAEGTRILVDGASGEVWTEPDEATTTAVLARATEQETDASPAVRTLHLDGGEVELAVNIGAIPEADRAGHRGARAVGLVRSELLAFAGIRDREDIASAARAIGDAIGGPIVFRLLDVGGDKPLEGVTLPGEPNPMLGARGIRLLASAREAFVEQVAGLAAVADEVDVWISIPMVIDPSEVERVRALWAEVSDQPPPPIGIMVETPAAVLLADDLAAVSDFLSIGTNDLTQYILATDRGNPAVAELADQSHPAVLRAIRTVVEAAERAGIPVAVCGQMAADPEGQRLLVGLGVHELSVPTEDLRATARALDGASMAELRALAVEATSWSSPKRPMMTWPSRTGPSRSPIPRVCTSDLPASSPSSPRSTGSPSPCGRLTAKLMPAACSLSSPSASIPAPR